MLHREINQRPASPSSLEQDLKASGEILELLPIATCICESAGRIVHRQGYSKRGGDCPAG
jgi:hypothetical protein